ncbi:MAG: hypothetical protein CMJ64_24670 [Planctomycetaceae bacterium]|jgi:hypothetical protein|nr:hypothetical protein [Planctomycetaceae bacterium]
MDGANQNLVPVFIALGTVAFAVGILLLISLLLLLRRKAPPSKPTEPDLRIDVASLGVGGPPESELQLECYSVPVRLAVLVIAPVGRAGTIPETDQLLEVVDQLVPGLVDVVSQHHPVVRFWAPQLSSQGFVNSFFHNVGLPGDKGKGTAWSSVAGKFNSGDHHYLVGFVFRAESANGIGQVAIEHDGQWNDVIRIRR